MSSVDLPLVSVVVTGYKRPKELARTIESFLSVVQYEPLELVLADDGSPEELRAPMRELPFDHFVFAERNRGLGANTNAGLAAAKGEFIFQLEDDWLCTGPADFLARGVELLRARPEIGIVRYTRVFSDSDELPPHEVPGWDSTVKIFRPEAGSDYFLYSNHPHLKSREFMEYMGPYKESRYMQRSEFDMRDRFNAQSRYAAALIEGCDSFAHIGEESSHRRPLPASRVGMFLDRFPPLRPLANVLRRLKRMVHPGP